MFPTNVDIKVYSQKYNNIDISNDVGDETKDRKCTVCVSKNINGKFGNRMAERADQGQRE